MKSRRERREEARKNKTEFEPQYKTGYKYDVTGKRIALGGEPKTYEEMFGIGYERFNNKFVTIKEVEVKEEE